jgi:hypothetical protein
VVASAALLLGAMLLPGCGKDDDASTAATTSSTTSSTTAGPTSTTAGGSPSTTVKVPDEYPLSFQAYGPIQLGMSLEAVEATGLVGPPTPGCELSGDPSQKYLALTAPLSGTVIVTDRKVASLFVRSHFVTSPGAVRAGDPLTKAQAVDWGHSLTVDKGSADTFGYWTATVDAGQSGTDTLLQLTIDPDTQKVTTAGIPYVPTCD